MDIMRVYDNLPVWMQNVACTVEGARIRQGKFGARTQRLIPQYMERAIWDYPRLCQYRDEKLRSMVAFCYHHVPYYHELFDSLQVDYREVRTIEDLTRIPILTKQDVRKYEDRLIADSVSKREIIPMHTSGTTGTGLHFITTRDAYAEQWAEYSRYVHQAQIAVDGWSAYFGGRPVVPKLKDKPPFYRINYSSKEILFSSWHLKLENYPAYIAALEKYHPSFWHGYPSTIGALAQYVLDSGTKLSFCPQSILLASEEVTLTTIIAIKDAFGVIPLQGYGQTEQVAVFWEYPGSGMRISEDFSAVELIPEDDSGLCRVVGTTLTNFGMPLLRYDTGDLVTWKLTSEGREICSIEGRLEDNIKLRDGGILRRLSRLFQMQINILEAQIIQKSLDLVEFHIVVGEKWGSSSEDLFRKSIEEYLANRIGYCIIYEQSIPRTKNGKIKFIVSEL